MRLKLNRSPESFLQSKGSLQKPCFVTSSRFVITILFVLLQNKDTTLAENGGNLISAHSQGPSEI